MDSEPQDSEPNEEYSLEYSSLPRGDRRRRLERKKPPVPVLPDGTWVQIGDSCRSSTLQGQVGTVVAWGRQVEVFLRGPDGSEGAVRKINPTDLIALSEVPDFTSAEPEQVTGEEVAPPRASARAMAPAPAPTHAHAPTRGVRSTPLGKSSTTPCERSGMDEVRTGYPAASPLGVALGGGRGRRPARQKKEPSQQERFELGSWVRVADACRSATLRGQHGVVLAVGRQVEVRLSAPVGMADDDEYNPNRKFNPNDLVSLGMEAPAEVSAASDWRRLEAMKYCGAAGAWSCGTGGTEGSMRLLRRCVGGMRAMREDRELLVCGAKRGLTPINRDAGHSLKRPAVVTAT
eukprot:CAMPEP_0119072374 /NCGR_PEP_ID=MMETSP1178-20130426/58328_1 /TAXON_ID=33656 /ORGANISM="unid sp, Strain CCMP2000" /LENGTH=346 /DNA_ID=CAMNT_0007054373 /DNA_START=40 /DNA_END=1081 /DNA_ORIENTATION=+